MNIRLDFTAPGPRPGPLAWSLLVLGLAAAGAAAHAWIAAAEEARAVDVRLAAAQAKSAPRKPRPAATDRTRAQAEAEARRALALPWDKLLTTLQTTRPEDVALLALDADGRQGGFQLSAVGRSHQAMLEYFRLLQTRPELGAVSLTQHETREIDGVQGVGFRLRGNWIAP